MRVGATYTAADAKATSRDVADERRLRRRLRRAWCCHCDVPAGATAASDDATADVAREVTAAATSVPFLYCPLASSVVVKSVRKMAARWSRAVPFVRSSALSSQPLLESIFRRSSESSS